MALLDDVKLHLRISGTDSDALLTRLINSAVREFINFTGITASSVVTTEEDAVNGIILAVQADYDGDPAKRGVYMAAAHALWMPYRVNMGV